eukprot:4536082-Prorocentrum_lima.AAC.1
MHGRKQPQGQHTTANDDTPTKYHPPPVKTQGAGGMTSAAIGGLRNPPVAASQVHGHGQQP